MDHVNILKDVIAYVEVRSNNDNRSAAVCRELEILGAKIETSFTDNVTHVVYKEGLKRTYLKAQKKGIPLVSVSWLESCKRNQQKVPEADFIAIVEKEPEHPILKMKLNRRWKKMKSMQPCDFDEEVARSAERNKKQRRRVELANRFKLAEDSTPPGGSPALVLAMDTQARSSSPFFGNSSSTSRFSSPFQTVVPETPATPTMKERIEKMRKEQRDVLGAGIDSPKSSVLETAMLQRKLFEKLAKDIFSVNSSDEEDDGETTARVVAKLIEGIESQGDASGTSTPARTNDGASSLARDGDRELHTDDKELESIFHSVSPTNSPKTELNRSRHHDNSAQKISSPRPNRMSLSCRKENNRKMGTELVREARHSTGSSSEDSFVLSPMCSNKVPSLGTDPCVSELIADLDVGASKQTSAPEAVSPKLILNSEAGTSELTTPLRASTSKDKKLSSASKNNNLTSVSKDKNLSSASKNKNLSSASKDKSLSSASKTNKLSSASKTNNPSSASKTNNLSNASKTNNLSSASKTNNLSSASKTNNLSSASKTNNLSSASKDRTVSSASKVNNLSEEGTPKSTKASRKTNNQPTKPKTVHKRKLFSNPLFSMAVLPVEESDTLPKKPPETTAGESTVSAKPQVSKGKRKRNSEAADVSFLFSGGVNSDKAKEKAAAPTRRQSKRLSVNNLPSLSSTKSNPSSNQDATLVETSKLLGVIDDTSHAEFNSTNLRRTRRSLGTSMSVLYGTDSTMLNSSTACPSRRSIDEFSLRSLNSKSKKTKAANLSTNQNCKFVTVKSLHVQDDSVEGNGRRDQNVVETPTKKRKIDKASVSTNCNQDEAVVDGKDAGSSSDSAAERLASPCKLRHAHSLIMESNVSSKVVGRRQPSLVMTSLHREEQDAVRSIVKKLGVFRLTNHVEASTTHVVCGEPRRTLNLLRGIAGGCWVLKKEWVFESLEVGKWVMEENHEMVDEFPVAKQFRLKRQTEGKAYKADLFSHLGPIFVSGNSVPPRQELVHLILLCSGKVTTSKQRALLFLGMEHMSGKTVVKPTWILDSVMKMTLQDPGDYIIPTSTTCCRPSSPEF